MPKWVVTPEGRPEGGRRLGAVIPTHTYILATRNQSVLIDSVPTFWWARLWRNGQERVATLIVYVIGTSLLHDYLLPKMRRQIRNLPKVEEPKEAFPKLLTKPNLESIPKLNIYYIEAALLL